MAFWLLLTLLGAGDIRIACSIPALSSIVQEIGGNKVNVFSVLGGFENPHTFSLKPKDLKKLENSKVIFIVGMHLEDWIPESVVESKGYVLSDSIGIKGENPHIWLSINYVKEMGRCIRDFLIKNYPEDSIYFKKRYRVFLSMLDLEIPKDCFKGKVVATMFPALDYLLEELGVKNIFTIIDVPGKRPSPKRIAEAIDIIRKNQVQVVVSIPFNDYGVSDAIVKETGVKVVTLIPQVGMEEGIDSIVELFRENIRRLKDGLCH